MACQRQITRKLLIGFVIIAALTMPCTNAQTILDVSHGAPPDPRPAIKRDLMEKPYLKWEDIFGPLDEATEAYKKTLVEGDYEAATEQLRAFGRFAGKLPTGGYEVDVSEYMMKVLIDRKDYRGVLWLAEDSPLALGQDPVNASHTGAFTYYYLALWRTRGLDAAEEAYQLGVEKSRHHPGGWRMRAALRTGWIETQVAAGELDRTVAKRELTVEALDSEYGLSLQANGAYITLVSVCLADKDYDCLRRVALRSLFTSDKSKLDHLWNSTLAPLWSLDDRGPGHLVALTEEYLADCEDPTAKVRAAFFQATMHRLQAAMLYESVMRSDEADKLFAAENDLHFAIVRQAWTKDSPLEIIDISSEKVPANSLSQQAARYLSNLAPGSPMRRWQMGPASDELKQRLRQRALDQARRQGRAEASDPPAKPTAPPPELAP